MKWFVLLLFMIYVASCAHPKRVGGDGDKLYPHSSGDGIAKMKLDFKDRNSKMTYCTITLLRNNNDWSLCYAEYERSSLDYNRNIKVRESKAEDIFQSAVALFKNPTSSGEDEFSLMVTMMLSDYVPNINEYEQLEYEVWGYHEDVAGIPQWDAFLKCFRQEFQEFDSLLNEVGSYKLKHKHRNEPLFSE